MEINSNIVSTVLARPTNNFVSTIAPNPSSVAVSPAPASGSLAPQAATTPVDVSPAIKSRDQLNAAIDAASKTLKHFSDSLDIEFDHSLQSPVVRVVDASTREVIKQIPNEDLVRIAHAIDDMQKYLLKDSA
jgi:flagellar protein FlaG